MKKGHGDFVAVIVDLDTGIVLDLLENRTKASLIAYFQDKGPAFCQQITVFASDMWLGYVETAKTVFPNAYIVTDRFHFYAHLQKCIDSLRKQLRNQHKEDKTLHKTKYLWLKNEADLTKKEKQTIKHILSMQIFEPLKIAYELKNEFRQILEDKNITRHQAELKITQWQQKITESNIKLLNDFSALLTRWKEHILNYFIDRITTGIIEGINNKIKLIKRRAYGFHYFPNFRLTVILNFIKD